MTSATGALGRRAFLGLLMTAGAAVALRPLLRASPFGSGGERQGVPFGFSPNERGIWGLASAGGGARSFLGRSREGLYGMDAEGGAHLVSSRSDPVFGMEVGP